MKQSVTFCRSVVYRRGSLYVLAVRDDLEEEYVHQSFMLRFQDGTWGYWPLNNRMVAHVVYDGPAGRTVASMSLDGQVQFADANGKRAETVVQGPEAPSNLRHLTCMKVIGGSIYLAGMARQVFRRPLSGGLWQRADRGTLVPPTSLEIAGFKAIDGLAENDIYAVGFNGDIWHFDGANWEQIDSPTNLQLTCVKCVSPDLVYVAGTAGIVLQGTRNIWKVLEHDGTKDSFWGIEHFQNVLYLATGQGQIFRLIDDIPVPVDIELELPVTTGQLHAGDGILLSTGSRHLIVFDGQTWSEVAHPGNS